MKTLLKFIFLILLLNSCSVDDKNKFYFDSESEQKIEAKYQFYPGKKSNKHQFTKANSIEISNENPYGLTLNFENVKAGEYFTASIYRKGHYSLTSLVADGSWKEHSQNAKWAQSELNGWQKLELSVEIPEGIESNSSLKFFAYNTSSYTSYVDSFFVIRKSNKTDTLIKKASFFPVLFELMNDFHIRNQLPIPFDSIPQYANSKHLLDFFINRGCSKNDFISTFNFYSNKVGLEEMQNTLNKMQHSIAFPNVRFIENTENLHIKPAGYVRNMFCNKNDTAQFVILGNSKCYTLSLQKLKTAYQSENIFIKTHCNDSLFKLPCKELSPGFYSLDIVSDKPTFRIPLIINHDNAEEAEVAIIAPLSTWHAYNTYGGKSLYRNAIDSSAVNYISTLRPINSIYFDTTFLRHDIYIFKNIYDWFSKQYKTSIYPDYYLESNPDKFKNCRSLVLAQHCEYFSSKMYSNLKEMLKTKNLLALGGNQVYWKIKWHNDFTLMECRKDQSFFNNSLIPGGLWRDSYFSESNLLGAAYTDAGYTTYAPYKITNPSHFLFEGIKVENGDVFGKKGIDSRALSGDELDKINSSSPESVQLIAKGTNPNGNGAEMVYFKNDNDQNASFSCGSIACGSGLGIDSVFTKIIENFMNKHHAIKKSSLELN